MPQIQQSTVCILQKNTCKLDLHDMGWGWRIWLSPNLRRQHFSRLVIPAALGTVVAFVVCLVFAFTFLPSVTSTILKLRSGVFPTLLDKRFNNIRNRMDLVSLVLGSLFWGTLFASLLVGGLLGGLLFLCLWQVRPHIAMCISKADRLSNEESFYDRRALFTFKSY